MTEFQFQGFPKIARHRRDIVITEKIDGTNAQVLIVATEAPMSDLLPGLVTARVTHHDGRSFFVLAGSRNHYITPNGATNGPGDNFGFAAWVAENAVELTKLGEGRFFGEWWGSGIQRGYGLPKGEKRWSLFPGSLHAAEEIPECCHIVPQLYEGPAVVDDRDMVAETLRRLEFSGSEAAPGFKKPEGIVVFHTASRIMTKITIGNAGAKGRE